MEQRSITRRRPQEPTEGVSVRTIMSSLEFEAGVNDVRKGVAPRFDEGGWDQWYYERGRLWARIAPRSLPLKKRGKVTMHALKLYSLKLIP